MFVEITESADADLAGIAEYTRVTWGEAQKSRYMNALTEKFWSLSLHPSLGHLRDDVPGYRVLSAGSHLIFYRLTEEAVVVDRILHQSMDASAHLAPEA